LRFVDGQEPFDCLYLDDQLSLDDEVKAIAANELDALVPDRYLQLSFEAQPSKAEFVSQALPVCRLEQTGA
jgi:hypothetical protein